MIPSVDNSFTFGNGSFRWTDIYAVNSTIQTSDRRNKKDIKPLENHGLDFINKLKPVSYKFKDGVRQHNGFIAQDVQKLTDSAILF